MNDVILNLMSVYLTRSVAVHVMNKVMLPLGRV